MSGSEEMRRVIKHASGQLEGALEREHKRSYPDNKTIAALAYSVGVMHLLASYLVVTDEPGSNDAAELPQSRVLPCSAVEAEAGVGES